MVRTSGADYAAGIGAFARDIGKLVYQSVAPYAVLRRTPMAKAWRKSLAAGHGWRGQPKPSAHQSLAAPDKGAAADVGALEAGGLARKWAVVAAAASWTRIRPPDAEWTNGTGLGLQLSFPARRRRRSAGIFVRHDSRRPSTLLYQNVNSGYVRAAEIRPQLAPIRVAARSGRHSDEGEASGSLLDSSSPVARRPVSNQESPAARPRTDKQRAGALFEPAEADEQRPEFRASVGRAIELFFAEQVRLPPSGIGGFDPRLSPAWAGLQIPG